MSGETRLLAGVASSRRMSVAAAPPRKKKRVMLPTYSWAMRLWSVVSSHERIVEPASR